MASVAAIVGVGPQKDKPSAPTSADPAASALSPVSSSAQPPAGTAESATLMVEREATANAKPCDKTVITNLDLSRPPSQTELIAAGNLGEKLTPTRSADIEILTDPAARKLQERDNLFFGTAIQAWNDHRYDEAIKLFAEHLQSFPDSPWAGESMLHLGCHHQYVGRFSESAEWFDKILASASKDTEMYHKATLRRTILNIDLGHLDEAIAGFSGMVRDDPDPNHQSYASYWLMQTQLLKKNETALRDCGQKALSMAANIMGNKPAADALFDLTAAGPHGHTAAELHSTAIMHGLEPQAVHARAALDALPLPFIAHYTDRHYVTVESVGKDSVKVYDSRIATSSEMPRASFEKNWSGFALLLKPAPADKGIHPAENLSEIVGGCCGQPTSPEDLGDEEGDCDSCGLPTYSVNSKNMNFKVKDTPMWWDAPVGPSVYMTLLFNSQDSLNNFEPFGEKWSFEYVSYLLIAPGNTMQLKDGNGRLQEFPAPVGGMPSPVVYPVTYQSAPGDFRVLKQTTLHDFTLTHQDGSVYQYGIPAAMTGTTSVPLLLSIKDRHNNTLSIVHNANGAITSISHSMLPGESWNLVYGTVGGHSRVIRIDDPFDRSCHFSYDSQGHLTGQTDMGGLSYGYTYTIKDTIDNTISYSGQTKAPQLFVESITTPTGTTTILTEPADGIDTTSVTYTPAEIAAGYIAVPNAPPYYSYPVPGGLMWTDYRITIRDHLNHPTEYYFDGFSSTRYIRNPAQMERPFGQVRPAQGARIEMQATLAGGKATISSTRVYDKDDAGNIVQVRYTTDSGYTSSSRTASLVDNGNGGFHSVERNAQGKPTVIKLNYRFNKTNTNGATTDDHRIDMSYIQPLGVDVDTITRKIKVTGGAFETRTLADYEYYPNRDIQSVTDVSGRTISYLWNSNGLPQRITDSKTGDYLVFGYDSHSRLNTTTLHTVVGGTPTSTVISIVVYDTEGKGTIQSVMGADGRTTAFQYDNLNRLTRELRSDDSFTAYQWACCYIEATRHGKEVGGLEKTLRRTTTVHDARALPTSIMESDGRVTGFEYDNVGRLIKLTDPKSQMTEWKYNTSGQLKEKIYPGGSKEKFTYVASSWGMGQIASFTNRRNQVSSFSYEYDGLPSLVDKPTGEQDLSYVYDTWRRIDTVTLNAASGLTQEIHKFTHDDLGRPTSIDGPWTEDTISYAYNDADRSETRTIPGSVTQTTAADAYGNVASVSNVLGIFTHNRGGLGGVLQSVNHTGVNAGFNTAFSYHTDVFDRALASITSTKPGGSTVGKHTYAYDSLGNVSTWKREAPLSNPTGSTRQFESKVFYDQADQVASLLHTPLAGSSVAESAHHYIYDDAGNIASKQVEVPGASSVMTPYSHNAQNQITGLGGSGGVRAVIVRGTTSEPAQVKVKSGAVGDSFKNARMLDGNRFEADLDLANGVNQIHLQAKDGAANQSNYVHSLTLVAAPSLTPTYDADGNMTSDGVRTYTWDSQSRLTKIAWGAGSNKTTDYKYNALGQRSERIDKTGSTVDGQSYYLYEGKDLLCRYTGGTAAANLDRRYLSQGEQRKISGVWGSYYYDRDHLGSIREVMNSDGSIAARYDYDPYGKRLVQYQAAGYTGGCDVGYTGHITQLSPVSGQGSIILTCFRAYDPDFGQWLSADPARELGGFNLYAYVGGNPVNAVDPLGLWQITIYGGHVLGGYFTIGYSPSSDQWNFGVRAGVGEGLSGSIDFSDAGCKHPGLGFAGGFDGTVGGGIIGGTAGFGSDSRQGDYGYVGGRFWRWSRQVNYTNEQPLHSPDWKKSVSNSVTNAGASGFLGAGISYATDGKSSCP